MRSGWSARDLQGRYIVAVSGGGVAYSDRTRSNLIDLLPANSGGRVLIVIECDGLLWFSPGATVELERVGDFCAFEVEFPKGEAPVEAPFIRLLPGTALGAENNFGSGEVAARYTVVSSASGHGVRYVEVVDQVCVELKISTSSDSHIYQHLDWGRGYPVGEIMRGRGGYAGRIPSIRVEDTLFSVGSECKSSFGIGTSGSAFTDYLHGFHFWWYPDGFLRATASYNLSNRDPVVVEEHHTGIRMDVPRRLGVEFSPVEGGGGEAVWYVDDEEVHRFAGVVEDWDGNNRNQQYSLAISRLRRQTTEGRGSLYHLLNEGLAVYVRGLG